MEHAYIVVAFYYLLTGGAPQISVKADLDEYRTYAAVRDCRNAKAAVMKKHKDVFFAECVKIPKVDQGVQVLPPRAEISSMSTAEPWSVKVETTESTSSIPWMGDKVKKDATYPQESELICRRIAELLERYGDKSKHKFMCDPTKVLKQP